MTLDAAPYDMHTVVDLVEVAPGSLVMCGRDHPEREGREPNGPLPFFSSRQAAVQAARRGAFRVISDTTTSARKLSGIETMPGCPSLCQASAAVRP